MGLGIEHCDICGQLDHAGHICELKYRSDECIDMLVRAGNNLVFHLQTTGTSRHEQSADIEKWHELIRQIGR